MAMVTNDGKDFERLDLTENLTTRPANELDGDITGRELIIDNLTDHNAAVSPSTYTLEATNDKDRYEVFRRDNNVGDAKFVCSFGNLREARKYVNELNGHVDLPDHRLKRLMTAIAEDLLDGRSTVHEAIMLTLSVTGYDQTQDFQAMGFAHEVYERYCAEHPDQPPFEVSEYFSKLVEENTLAELYASLEYLYRQQLRIETVGAVVQAVMEIINRKG